MWFVSIILSQAAMPPGQWVHKAMEMARPESPPRLQNRDRQGARAVSFSR